MQNISIFYLPIFNSVVKEAILRWKKYLRGISPPCTLQILPMLSYIRLVWMWQKIINLLPLPWAAVYSHLCHQVILSMHCSMFCGHFNCFHHILWVTDILSPIIMNFYISVLRIIIYKSCDSWMSVKWTSLHCHYDCQYISHMRTKF
jgi:hypothetical protein